MITIKFKNSLFDRVTKGFSEATINGKKWSCDNKEIEKWLNLTQRRIDQGKERIPDEVYSADTMVRRFLPGRVVYSDNVEIFPPTLYDNNGVEITF